MNWIVVVFTLLSLGLLLVAVEVLIIPGVGFIGILGAAFVIAASIFAHLKLSSVQAALTMGGGMASMVLMFWLLPKTKFAKSMVLETQIKGSAAEKNLGELLGRTGIAKTNLRPAGVALFDEAPIDVVSDGEYIEVGTRVRVDKVEGNRVVVQILP